ncbi:hypothetical protein RDV89_13830 [Nocardioides zeae]|uniref:XRE family transcriptional regulator n=1 Tax=Nocardioides imazamoxiresistens TaxID=3231893 RepID=A0ABU3PY42_9ACTN|nr:hypothetical protein [Nocardioides zeae]MDT9594158.1 hypothetical protein [Nocardioides zeae]
MTAAPSEATDQQASAFASALRAAVEDSGLGLESIQRRLAQRGVRISVATLSYWQTGARTPGRRASLEAVVHLEQLFGLEAGALVSLVPPPRPRGPVVRRTDEVTLPRFAARAAVRRVTAAVENPHSVLLTRLSHHDEVVVDAERRLASARTRIVGRADDEGLTGMGITQFLDDPTAGTPRLTVHGGGRVEVEEQDAQHRVVGVRLAYDVPLARGETVLVDYELSTDGPGPRDTSFDASCSLVVREYVLVVRFPPHDPPTRCEAYQVLRDGSPVFPRRRVRVDERGHAVLVALDCPPGTVGMAWSWDA